MKLRRMKSDDSVAKQVIHWISEDFGLLLYRASWVPCTCIWQPLFSFHSVVPGCPVGAAAGIPAPRAPDRSLRSAILRMFLFDHIFWSLCECEFVHLNRLSSIFGCVVFARFHFVISSQTTPTQWLGKEDAWSRTISEFLLCSCMMDFFGGWWLLHCAGFSTAHLPFSPPLSLSSLSVSLSFSISPSLSLPLSLSLSISLSSIHTGIGYCTRYSVVGADLLLWPVLRGYDWIPLFSGLCKGATQPEGWWCTSRVKWAA